MYVSLTLLAALHELIIRNKYLTHTQTLPPFFVERKTAYYSQWLFIAGRIAGIVVGVVGAVVISGVILIGYIVYKAKKEKVCCFYDQVIT